MKKAMMTISVMILLIMVAVFGISCKGKVPAQEPAEESIELRKGAVSLPANRLEAVFPLYADPAVGGEFVDNPLAVEAADTGGLFSSEHDVGFIIDRLIVDMDHTGSDFPRYLNTMIQVPGENTA